MVFKLSLLQSFRLGMRVHIVLTSQDPIMSPLEAGNGGLPTQKGQFREINENIVFDIAASVCPI